MKAYLSDFTAGVAVNREEEDFSGNLQVAGMTTWKSGC